MSSPRHHVVAGDVLEPLQSNCVLEVRGDPVMRGLMRIALHVRHKVGACPPSADHEDFVGAAVRSPYLEAQEPGKGVDQARAGAEGIDEPIHLVVFDPESRDGHVHAAVHGTSWEPSLPHRSSQTAPIR